MDLSGVGVWSSHLRYGNPDVAGGSGSRCRTGSPRAASWPHEAWYGRRGRRGDRNRLIHRPWSRNPRRQRKGLAERGCGRGSPNGEANRAGAPAIRRRCRCRTPIRCRVQRPNFRQHLECRSESGDLGENLLGSANHLPVLDVVSGLVPRADQSPVLDRSAREVCAQMSTPPRDREVFAVDVSNGIRSPPPGGRSETGHTPATDEVADSAAR